MKKRRNSSVLNNIKTRLRFERLEDRRMLSVAPVLAISIVPSTQFRQGDYFDQYTVTVTNTGSVATSGTVTVTDDLPADFAYGYAQGTNWTASDSGQTITATQTAALQPGDSYPVLTIAVDPNVNTPTPYANTVTVSGGGAADASDTDNTTVIQAAYLVPTSTHTPSNFTQGDAADTYTINVANEGYGPTNSQETVVTDDLPAGVTATAASGTGWTTSINALGTSVTASQVSTLQSGDSYSPITITVSVSDTAAASVTNTVQVNGGGMAITGATSTTDPTTVNQLPILGLTNTDSGNFRQGDTADTYTLAVNNSGNASTSGAVTVTDTLPTGVTFQNLSGSGWALASVSGQTVTVTNTDTLDSGDSYPNLTLTVSVAVNCPASITNNATVTGGGSVDTDNEAATDTTTVAEASDLTLAMSDSGDFAQGGTTSTYTLTASNIGAGPTIGTATITDTLPTGMTATAASGTDWTIVSLGQTVVATNNDIVAAGAGYSPLVITISTSPTAPASLTNNATVSGGGELNTSNDSASDITTIAQLPDLTISETDSGDFRQGGSGSTYSLVVNNIGNSFAFGLVTVTQNLPAGLTPISASGSEWTTSISGQTVTATTRYSLSSDSSYPAIVVTVAVASDAPASVTSTCSVAGGGEVITDNDSASDTTTVAQAPDLTVTKTDASNGVFLSGDTADNYTIMVTNSGGGPTVGAVTIVDPVPSGLTVVSATSADNIWDIQVSGNTVTATRSDELDAGDSYDPITVTVSVPTPLLGGVLGDVTNTATVSGGGELNTSNDTGSDTVDIQATPIITVAGPVDITYGTDLDNSQLSGLFSASFDGIPVAGTFTYSTAAGTVLTAVNGQVEGVTFTPTDTTDYTSTTSTVTVNVAQATPNVTVNPVNLRIGTALDNSQLSGTATWTVNGATVTVPGTYVYTTADGQTLALGDGQTEDVTFTPTDTTDYTAVSTTTTVNVNLFYTPVITVNPVSITYGTALDSSQLSGTATANDESVAGTFTYTSAEGAVLTVGSPQSEDVTFTPTDTTDYATVTGTVAVTVTQATPTVTTVTPVNITYGTVLDNSQLAGTVTWTVGGTAVTVPGTFTYTTVDGTTLLAGNGQVENVTFMPTDTTDYTAVTSSVTVNVAQGTPVVASVTPINITYGTALANSQIAGSADYTVAGEAVTVPGTFTFTSAEGTVLTAGNDQIEGVTFTPTDTSDYTSTTSTVTVNVAQASPTLSVTPVSITYGTALDDSQLTGTANWTVGGTSVTVPGTFTYNPDSSTVLTVTSGQTENVTFTPTDTTDYATTAGTVAVTVGQATPDVTMNPVNITYGTALTDSQLSGTVTWTVGGAPVTVAGTFTYGSGGDGTVLTAGSGQTGPVTFTPTDTTDYAIDTDITGTVNVALATPTIVSVSPVNIAYGTALANSQLSGTAQWTVNGSVVTVPGTFTYTSAAGSTLLAGTGQSEDVTFTPTDTTDYNTATGTVTVNVSLALSPTTLTGGTVGALYSQSITASGGTSPYTFSITSGALPAGLSISTSGAITGTPTSVGTASFTISVNDAASPANSVSQAYQLTVAAAANNSLAGYVYIDANNTGQRLTSTGQAKIGISGVTVHLLSENGAGAFVEVSGVSPITTASDGSYDFTGLGAGTYEIEIAPPSGYNSGIDTPGQIAGVTEGAAGTNEITVQLAAGQNGTEYDFGQHGMSTSGLSMLYLLSSSIGQTATVLQNATVQNSAIVSAAKAPIVAAAVRPVPAPAVVASPKLSATAKVIAPAKVTAPVVTPVVKTVAAPQAPVSLVAPATTTKLSAAAVDALFSSGLKL